MNSTQNIVIPESKVEAYIQASLAKQNRGSAFSMVATSQFRAQVRTYLEKVAAQ